MGKSSSALLFEFSTLLQCLCRSRGNLSISASSSREIAPYPKKDLYQHMCHSSCTIAHLTLQCLFFHTINLSSLLSNLIAVPIASCFLYATTALLTLPENISRFLMPICEGLSWLLTKYLHAVSSIMLNLHDLYPTAIETILWYIVLSCIMSYWQLRKKVYFHATWLSLVLLLGYSIGVQRYLTSREEIVIFHAYRKSAILVNEKGYCFTIKNTSGIPEKERPYVLYHHLQPLPEAAGILGHDLQWLPPCLYYGKDTIWIPDGKQELPYTGNTAIITEGISPQQVFGKEYRKSYPPLILLDGSNHPLNVENWQAFCAEHHLLFSLHGRNRRHPSAQKKVEQENISLIFLTLEYNPYPFIIRTLGRFPDFEVTNCQPFLLLYSALICFLGNSI